VEAIEVYVEHVRNVTSCLMKCQCRFYLIDELRSISTEIFENANVTVKVYDNEAMSIA
jgi:hypothetical protein